MLLPKEIKVPSSIFFFNLLGATPVKIKKKTIGLMGVLLFTKLYCRRALLSKIEISEGLTILNITSADLSE